MLNGTSVTWEGLLPVLAASVPQPATGHIIFHESADGLLKAKDSSGVVTIIVQTNAAGVIVGPISVRNLTEAGMNLVTLLAGEIAWTSDYGQIRLGDGVTEGGLPGNMASQYTILCPPIGTPTENGDAYLAALVRAATLTPQGNALAEDNRVLIQCGAGAYLFSADVTYDTSYIDTAGIGDVKFNAAETGVDSAPNTIFELDGSNFIVSCRDTKISHLLITEENVNLTNANNNDMTVFSHVVVEEDVTSTVTSGSSWSDCFVEGSLLASVTTLGRLERILAGTSSFTGDADGVYIDIIAIGTLSFTGTCSGTFTRCKVDPSGLVTTSASTKLYDCLHETGIGTGVYVYMPENVKRLNGSDSDSDTGIDMTSTATITWTNASGYALQVSSTLALSNLDTGAETFSVEITSASGANTFTSTKASGATHTINIPQYLGSVADAADYEIDIITDNASNTSVNYTLTVVEQAVL